MNISQHDDYEDSISITCLALSFSISVISFFAGVFLSPTFSCKVYFLQYLANVILLQNTTYLFPIATLVIICFITFQLFVCDVKGQAPHAALDTLHVPQQRREQFVSYSGLLVRIL